MASVGRSLPRCLNFLYSPFQRWLHLCINIYMTSTMHSLKPWDAIYFQSRQLLSLSGDSCGFFGNVPQRRWTVKVLVKLGNFIVVQGTDVLFLGWVISNKCLRPIWIQSPMVLLGMTGHTGMESQLEITWGGVLWGWVSSLQVRSSFRWGVPLKIINPKPCAIRSLQWSDNATLNKSLPVALTEVTGRNPHRRVQGKELVLSDWKMRCTCPAQRSQEMEKFIALLSLPPPPHFLEGQHPSHPQCAMQQTSISRQ